MVHRNASMSAEGCRRLVERCENRPISHVAAEMGISRACASTWVNHYLRHGATGLHERSSVPHRSPRATSGATVATIDAWRRKWSAARITAELAHCGTMLDRRTVTRHPARLGLARRRFIDPAGASNRAPGRITAHWPGHMVHLDVKKVARIPDGGGCRMRGRDSVQTRAVDRAKSAGAAGGYLYLHSAVDGFSRLAYTEALGDEKGATAAAFLARAKVFFAAHGITHLYRVVTDNGTCYRLAVFSRIVGRRTKHRRAGRNLASGR
ncbi:transposase [Lipingzhangella halophila]|uniref:Transposase n=1 Tax=Lipingzhangella halophila TaxID=1783352 RepID=A0A7W7RFG4_9ACTN|nr:transposase [Lipingzhangella halophila]